MIWHYKPFENLTNHELYDLLTLRTNVFVVEQNCPYPECDGVDKLAHHLWASKNGIPIAYTRIIPPGVNYPQASLGRFVVDPVYRKANLGSQLLHFAVEIVETRYPNQGICISAQAHLVKFYQSGGFQPVGETYLEDNIPHIQMTKR